MRRALTAADVAAELGRSVDWLHRHWRQLVKSKQLPEPLLGRDGGELSWSAAQVYAVLDRGLTPRQQAAAAAYRAAAEAYVFGASPEAAAIAASRARLDRRAAS